MKRIQLSLIAAGIGLVITAVTVTAQKSIAAPPEGFQTVPVITNGLNSPTAFEILPDGRIFILEKEGLVKIYKNGQLLPQPFMQVEVDSDLERGLLGIAVDPNFHLNHFVYFYYTGPDLHNYIIRVNAEADTITGFPLIVYQTPGPEFGGYHLGATIRFGPDGKLYAAIGDNGYGNNAQDLGRIFGKVIRINSDGSIPTDNPFYGQPGKLPEVWAYGLRNPFRFHFDSLTGDLMLGDVGQQLWEELNVITRGGNYGWPAQEGMCEDCPYTNPLYSYFHTGNQSYSITGGPVYRGTSFPESYQGDLFFGDFAKGFIKRLEYDLQTKQASAVDFDMNAGTVVDIKTGSDGNLYYITIFPGALYKVVNTNGNQVPVVKALADKVSGDTPLTVQFDGSESFDPEGNTLTYHWDFGDGTESSEASPQKTFSTKGKFSVVLTISDGDYTIPGTPVVIQVGTPPTLSITLPPPDSAYAAGETITYAVFAQDSTGAILTGSAVKTDIVFHHGSHIHPFQNGLEGASGNFTVPANGEASPDTWYEILATATDSNGLTSTKSRNVFPRTSDMTFVSNPPGLKIHLDGTPVTTPITITGVEGFKREITFPNQSLNGSGYEFSTWSDGGAKTHTLTTPLANTTYTVTATIAAPWNAQYYLGTQLAGEPVLSREDADINFTWNDSAPAAELPSDNFSVRWTKTKHFDAGRYKFVTSTDDGVRLYIDGTMVIDQWHTQGETPYAHQIDLTQGSHTIIMEYFEATGGAVAKLSWDLTEDQPAPQIPPPAQTPPPPVAPPPVAPPPPPETFSDYKGEYFDNSNLAGTPTLTRNDETVNFDWQHNSPGSPIGEDHFSVRWTKDQLFEAGTYEFTVTADDGVRLYIDHEIILNKWIDQSSTTYITEKYLTAGVHNIKIEYYENGGGAIAKFDFHKSSSEPMEKYQAKYWNLTGSTFPPNMPNGEPTLTRLEDEIDHMWHEGSPDPSISTEAFAAEWTRNVTVEGGNYRFTVKSDDGVRVYVDDELLINQWNDHAMATFRKDKQLEKGQHTIKVEYYEHGGGAIAQFSFGEAATPLPTFTGEYFDNPNLEGTPAFTRQDDQIFFLWGKGAPDSSLPIDGFSARWTKKQLYTEGDYTFEMRSGDGARLYIDDQLVIDDWTDHPLTTHEKTVHLAAGEHTIKMEYYDRIGGAVAILEER